MVCIDGPVALALVTAAFVAGAFAFSHLQEAPPSTPPADVELTLGDAPAEEVIPSHVLDVLSSPQSTAPKPDQEV